MKLGELLVHERIITQAQLEDALQWQVLYGVRLGRALIELGYVNEHLVAQTLSKKLGVPAVGRAELLSLEPHTVSLISREVAVLYRAIPLGVSGRLLRVAMTDPTDPQALDAIAQETGSILQALVSPDIIICLALEKYYGNSCVRHGLPPISSSAASGYRTNQTDPDADNGYYAQEITAEGSDIDDDMNEAGDDVVYADLPLESDPEGGGVIELDPFSVSLASARSREEVADAVMLQIASRFPAVALVIMRGNNAIGWRVSIDGQLKNCCTGTPLPLGVSPLIRALAKGKTFSEPFLSIPDHFRIQEELQLPPGSFAFALPVILQKKAVAGLIIWGPEKDLTEAEAELRRMGQKITLALQMLIIRSKLLMS
jgi:Type II secretion system (T2SS), protein E, N-terminal domain